MNFVFRVDASNKIGLGHLSRCMSLADELRKRGNDVAFVSRNNPGNCFELLTERLFRLVILPASVDQAHFDLLGVSQAVDAQQTIAALGGDVPNWLIVDHYGINNEWEAKLRPHCKNILVIDDLVDRKHDCDLYLNQNYLGEITDELSMVLPVGCKTLLGPHYALIKETFSRMRQVRHGEARQPKRVLIFCGGSDPENLTGLMMDALRSEVFSNLEVDVVVGSNNKFAGETNYNSLPTNFKKHSFTENFSDLLKQADLALGAGGVTTWERMCVGVPSIVASIALNQERTCIELAKVGAITYLGKSSEVKIDIIKKAMNRALNETATNTQQKDFGQVLVDGLGAMRVAEVLSPSSVDNLKIRKAISEDVLTYYVWASDEEVRKQSKNQNEIELSSHRRWFSEKLNSLNSQLFVLEASGLPVGQVRLDKVDNEVQIDYSLDLIVRSRGWASVMIGKVLSLYRGKGELVYKAIVKETNLNSLAVFEKLGFTKMNKNQSNRGGGLRIAVVTDHDSWISSYLDKLVFDFLSGGHHVLYTNSLNALSPGDICFYLSFSKIVPNSTLEKFAHNLVVHESDLPSGKGWSPLTWQILQGKSDVPVVLFEAVEKVDAGRIYYRGDLLFNGDELLSEMRKSQGNITIELCRRAVNEFNDLNQIGLEQSGEETYFPKRRPPDSRLNSDKTLREQFDLLRVVDNDRYPAFFEINGLRYELKIKKIHPM